jgi:hypothetical protein
MAIGECDSITPVQIKRSRGESAHVLNSWRRMRRATHEALTKRAIQNYHPIQMKEATVLVSSLLAPSTNLKQDRHFKRLAASTIMSIVYDYPTILSEHDNALEKIERYNDRMRIAVTVGSYFVDVFPLMKYIPERYWRPLCCLIVNNDKRNKSDLQNGSGKAYKHLKSTLRCSETVCIVLKRTLYVYLLSMVADPINGQQRQMEGTSQVSARH